MPRAREVEHTVVSGRGKVEADEVGQEKCPSRSVPRAIADVEGRGRVGAAPWGSQLRGHLEEQGTWDEPQMEVESNLEHGRTHQPPSTCFGQNRCRS